MSKVVLDASAVLALLNMEPGHEQVEAVIGDACISSVNLSEVLSKLVDAGLSDSEASESVSLLGIEVIPLTQELAEQAAWLRRSTRKKGLSLGDRACLALGLASGLEVRDHVKHPAICDGC